MNSAPKPLLVLACLLLTGCSTPKVQPVSDDPLIRSGLPLSIEDGVTTRTQVLLKLGTPSMQFEGRRILTYRIGINKHGTAQVLHPDRSELRSKPAERIKDEYSLVLVFGPNGILERHSLVGAK